VGIPYSHYRYLGYLAGLVTAGRAVESYSKYRNLGVSSTPFQGL
jgi:hypothetical protein